MVRDLHAPTRVLRNAVTQSEGTLRFCERVALFSCALSKERAAELMAGFASGPRELAIAQARQTLRWDSATRQARVTHEFGVRADHLEALKKLIAECAPALRAAVYSRLAPWQQSLFPTLQGCRASPAAPPALLRLADRLVREATR